MFNSFILSLAVALTALTSCNSKATSLPQSDKVQYEAYTFLDSTAASLFIVQDKSEDFFGKIQSLDASIQQGKACSDAHQCLSGYKNLLQSEVMNFSQADKELMTSVMDSALVLVNRINPLLVDRNIKLIKVRAEAYGPSVYYTRDEGIIIPFNVLEKPVFEDLLSVMLHEISHIVSRYHPSFKESLYATIGFEKYGKDLKIPEILKQRLLHNPDGLNMDYAINLKQDKKSATAIPLIISNVANYDPQRTSFFSYLKFDLYRIVDQGDYYEVQCKENGTSELDASLMASFFEQIKDNTQYIIHPDEILADNFMLLAMANGNIDETKFSEEGLALIKKIESKLIEFK